MSCFLHTLSAEGSDIVKTLSWDRVSLRGSGLTASWDQGTTYNEATAQCRH